MTALRGFSRIRRPGATLFIAATLVGATGSLTACSQSPVKASVPAQGHSQLCRAAAAQWPVKVGGKSRYPVSVTSDSVRAWGSDAGTAIIVRCGVTPPGPTTDSCESANNIDWVQTRIDGGYRYVTYGRNPAIEVLIPDAAHVDGTVLAAFSSAASKIPQNSHRCS